MKKLINTSLFVKLFIVGIIILSILSFTAYMGVIAAIHASKNIEDLSYANGYITHREMTKYKRVGKYKTTIEDAFVLSIDGSDEKFGFLQSSDAFKELLGFHTVGKKVEIYYDPYGERIGDQVTLHIFDLTIGQAKIIDIEVTKKENRIVSIFFFGLTLFLMIIIWIGLKGSRKKFRQLHKSNN